ncbi:hypothetical protein ACJ41O_011475 [Fusarium nematophilum]
MLNTLWKSPADLDHQIPSHHDNDNSLVSRSGLRNVVIFCSTRVWRGGPKLLLQITAFLLTIFILFGLLPERLSGGGFSSGYKGILPWKTEPLPEANLRLVVFGSPDIVGSAVDGTQSRRTWTEELCEELNCTSHISLVPSGDSSRGFVSNNLYEQEVQNLLNVTRHTDIMDKPALDYNYVAQQYPVPSSQVPDLAAQVQKFLAMPPPEDTPRETLWIFTFGTWEIWHLAAMPRQEAQELIGSMVDLIFSQAELLYRESLDPTSIAYSDFWSNATKSQVTELTAPGAIHKVDERRFESFRVLIPQLFDISLTPGWRGRPKPPFPNTPAEQTRNAAELTRLWNEEVDYGIAGWRQKATKKPEGFDAEKVEEEPGKQKRADSPEEVGHGEDPSKEDDGEKSSEGGTLRKYLPASFFSSNKAKTNETEEERVILAPYPLRNGWQLNPAKAILDAMTEEEMQRLEVMDSRGHGTLSVNDSMRFLDVWTPCVRAKTADLTVDMEEMDQECQIPDDHLFYDSFTVSERAIKGVAKKMAEDILENLFDRKPKSSWYRRLA